MEPLRRWADVVIDTTRLSASDLQGKIRDKFRVTPAGMTVSIMSFGFSRGVPHNADLIFDMRFLKNPHWDAELRPKTGLDADVAEYIARGSRLCGCGRARSPICCLPPAAI